MSLLLPRGFDNVAAASFFATLQFEQIMKNDRQTRAGSRRAIFRCITTCYNRKRRHYTLCYIGLSRVQSSVTNVRVVFLSLLRPLLRSNSILWSVFRQSALYSLEPNDHEES